ncbi:hypothetical protein GpartN1_g96.t1 [Galdieria partita]|uniref:Uncharacterized protein n=1 Tax=Galdieria partita TaxID=83374 RepID=A0A9C7UM23_9RHOD|nr:hypothetical protein GpartN1_g96.t1 [Galdieria partita]
MYDPNVESLCLRRVSLPKNFKRETVMESKKELGFVVKSLYLPRLLMRCDRTRNSSEGYAMKPLKNKFKRRRVSNPPLIENFCESGSNSDRRLRKKGGSIVLVWYRETLNTAQALKDAKKCFPFSKIFLIVFGEEHKTFISKTGFPKSMLKDTIFLTGSGCSYLDVPFAAYTLGARHVFAAMLYENIDMELYKVRHACLRYGICIHVSTGNYLAKSLMICASLLFNAGFSRSSALADTSSTIWERNLRRGSIIPYQISGDMIQEGRYEDDRPMLEKLTDWLSRIYLPDGYPNSVTKDYLSYSIWRAIQNLAASVMGVFATEALLFGLGLGRKSTPATSAAISWVLKDGLGYIGKVFYGSIAGNQFDVDPKSWRLAADAVEDAGGVLEIVTPLFPSHFLLLASVANAMKGVAAMTGTATRHAIYKSLALRENQGDIATKGESQGVTCKMVGLGLGIVASSKIGQKYFALLSAYALGCFVHLFANWKSLSCIQFATLNRQRCSLALEEFLQTGIVPGPYEVSRREKVVIPPWKGYLNGIVVGATLRECFQSGSELKEAVALYKGCRYMLTQRGNKILIVLHENCRTQDIFQAFMQAHKLQSGSNIQSSLVFAKRHIKEFLRSCSLKGWNTQYPLMGCKPVRVRW